MLVAVVVRLTAIFPTLCNGKAVQTLAVGGIAFERLRATFSTPASPGA